MELARVSARSVSTALAAFAEGQAAASVPGVGEGLLSSSRLAGGDGAETPGACSIGAAFGIASGLASAATTGPERAGRGSAGGIVCAQGARRIGSGPQSTSPRSGRDGLPASAPCSCTTPDGGSPAVAAAAGLLLSEVSPGPPLETCNTIRGTDSDGCATGAAAVVKAPACVLRAVSVCLRSRVSSEPVERAGQCPRPESVADCSSC
mmetsp:Transcript_18717/g.61213  ORF Transcript_18717/g.61213 Transcript_18717/m.61213 type:complete len:207 (+) Transcript_18717:515-1135(+)